MIFSFVSVPAFLVERVLDLAPPTIRSKGAIAALDLDGICPKISSVGIPALIF